MRVFVYDSREFPDPDPNLTPDEVRQTLAGFFPELANAEVKERQEGANTVYEFARRVGTKGKTDETAVINRLLAMGYKVRPLEGKYGEYVIKAPDGREAIRSTKDLERVANNQDEWLRVGSHPEETPYKPIVFKSEDSLWRMLAERGVTGIPAKTWELRRWDMSDERVYRLSRGFTGGLGRRWKPDEPYVSFYNKATGSIISFEYQGVEFVAWAPGWAFIMLGDRVELSPTFFEVEQEASRGG